MRSRRTSARSAPRNGGSGGPTRTVNGDQPHVRRSCQPLATASWSHCRVAAARRSGRSSAARTGPATRRAKSLPLTWGEGKNVRWKTRDARPRLVVAGHPRRPGLADDGDAGWPRAVCRGARSGEREDRARPEAVPGRDAAVRASRSTPTRRRRRSSSRGASTSRSDRRAPRRSIPRPARCSGNVATSSAITIRGAGSSPVHLRATCC